MPDLTLDVSTTALILIDITNGLMSTDMLPYSSETVKTHAVALAEAFRSAGGFVVLTAGAPAVTAQPNSRFSVVPTAPFARSGDLSALMSQASQASDPGSVVAELGPKAGDLMIRKPAWSAFFQTDLDFQLRRRNITTLVVGGVATNFGAESTGRDARARGYGVIAVEDAMRAVTAEEHFHAVRYTFPMIGLVHKTADVVAAVG